MGKPKKGKKGRQDEDFGDDEGVVDSLAQAESIEDQEPAAPKPAAAKKAKGKKKKKDDDWGDDVSSEIAALSLAGDEVANGGDEDVQPKSAKAKRKEKKKKRMEDSDGEDEDDDVTSSALPVGGGKGKGMSAFAMLAMEEAGNSEGEDEEEDEEDVPVPKKKGKDAKPQQSIEDEDLENFEREPQQQQQKKKGKKEKKKKAGDEEDIDAILAELEKPAAKPEGKKKKKKAAGDEEDIDAILAELEKPAEKPEGKKKKKKAGDEEDIDAILADLEKPAEKPEGKKKKNKAGDEEDMDAILADLEKPAEKPEGNKKKKKKGGDEEAEPETASTKDISESKDEEEESGARYSEAMTAEDIAKMYEEQENEEVEIKLKKKQKKKKPSTKEETTVEKEEDLEVEKEEDLEAEKEEDEDDTGSTVKTAAQKKKEKRERQKQQKLLEKQTGKKQVKAEDVGAKEVEEAPAADGGEMGSDKEAEDDDKKKKKKDRKKKKGEKEEEEKKKKPGNKQLRAMQEALQKLKEDEERLEREEEDKIHKLEEARKAKEEAEKFDKEKKEKEKQKKKERIERQKKEGTFKTKAQKEAEKRAKQLLEARGLDLPPKPTLAEGEKKKRIVYDSRPRKKKLLQQQNSQEEATVAMETVEVEVEKVEPVAVKEEEEVEVVLDSWEDVEEKVDEPDAGPVKPDVEEEAEKESEAEDESDEEEESEDESSDEEEEEESSEDESSDEDSSDDGLTSAERARDRAEVRINKRLEQAKAKKSVDDLRAPVVCVLGHVDTGKTKILDKLRKTNVQDGEAGGITQQIGATNVPADTIRTQTKMCKEFAKKELKLPGLLIIDTPGHESFSNLRTRGSSLCDIAVLVVDIMHGLEPQTIESINLLKMRKTPFVVALNKIDRLFQWQPNPHSDICNTLKKQKPNTKVEFDERVQQAVVQFAEQGLNVALSYENKNPREYISLCPTSAISGDGMGNLIALICELSQSFLADRLAYLSFLHATVMEVKALPGLGMTIDVILVNGHLKEGDTIVVAGTEGPIVTPIRGLLMPQPLRELRVKGAYIHFKEIKAAQGVKIIARDLDKALAGLPLYVAERDDEVEYYKDDLENSLQAILEGIKVQTEGVFVQASTLGSLEALLEFLRTSRIPYAGINIGPVHRRDIMRASVMLEHDSQYAVILAFDVKVEREAQEMADNLGVKIFTADIIYHLFDAFTAYRDEIKRKHQEEYKSIAVFPCKMRILPQCIFNSRDPIVCGVVVEAGFVKEGTPVCVPSKGFLEVGHVTSIELNHKAIDTARKGQEVCVKIECLPGDTPKLYGRHFDHTDILTSKISRQSIDAVKNYFREEMTKADWQLIMELKKLFEIL